MAPAFDEMTLAGGANRPGYEALKHWLDGTPIDSEELAVPALEGRVLQVGRRSFVRLV